ncbi:alkaline phosphatase family protein [Saccharopolyspora sp. TS4A08]|uniref:Alkaline phosphatase family protein n=1 Tax=Saccharopolyspora ipomoeae TaxID=3042027 RepID=A0ABT6PL91_9PSEU|nr:alkaline phosphatase family protein [Saccharopolyspora sp. TS4A08]MDI2028765.1 alkaline phosphatase family protein [Saccharopolyspora sp. TS4A08]
MDWIVAPDPSGRALRDVLPSMLSAMGVEGFTDTIGIPPCRNALVLLVDGLGHELLREHAVDAPFLSSLQTTPPLTAGFPTTTVTSITSLATGRCAGEHGLVGYTFAEPGGGLLHPLSWTARSAPGGADDERSSLIEKWPPEQVQPHTTVLERAVAAGVDVRTAVPPHFEGTGLTRASLRGGRFRGVRELGDLAAELLAAAESPGPTLCYGYHGGVDLLGHVHGPGSVPWRMQLRQVDAFVRMIAEALPPGAVLGVVADHGMVDLDPAEAIDADSDPALSEGVRLLGGEVRVRHVYARAGARGDVLAAWRDTVGPAGAVMTGEQAIDEGYFGPVSAEVAPRIGDVLAIMRTGGVIRSAVEPGESALRGHHGSLTAAEQLVPVLVTGG